MTGSAPTAAARLLGEKSLSLITLLSSSPAMEPRSGGEALCGTALGERPAMAG
jgi:hypothetical protein